MAPVRLVPDEHGGKKATPVPYSDAIIRRTEASGSVAPGCTSNILMLGASFGWRASRKASTFMANSDKATPDFRNGLALADLPDGGMVLGRVDTDDAILARRGDAFFAVGAHCTHYHGPLADGLIVGDTVRCPWHHACFSLRTGEALRAPALDPIACWRVERVGDTVFVRERLAEPGPGARLAATSRSVPTSVVIIGGGAAGLA